MTEDQQKITDEGDLRKYRTEIPNMADDEMNPFEYRLYGHYKRVCGAKGGICFESVRTTAKTTQMGIGHVIDTRHDLATRGWLEIHAEDGVQATLITMIDRWLENTLKYTPDADAILERINLNRSSHEQLVPETVRATNSRSPGEPKNKDDDDLYPDQEIDQTSSSLDSSETSEDRAPEDIQDDAVEVVRGINIPAMYRHSNPFEVWEQEFRHAPLSEWKAQQLGGWMDDLSEREVVAGIIRASYYQATSPFAYVEKMFMAWLTGTAEWDNIES